MCLKLQVLLMKVVLLKWFSNMKNIFRKIIWNLAKKITLNFENAQFFMALTQKVWDQFKTFFECAHLDENLLNFTIYTKKFHNWHHTTQGYHGMASANMNGLNNYKVIEDVLLHDPVYGIYNRKIPLGSGYCCCS